MLERLEELQPTAPSSTPQRESSPRPPDQLADVDHQPQFAGDPILPGSELIEVRVTELQQLFNAIDASPFRDRDLDPDAEEFIASWAREAPREAKLALLVSVNRTRGLADEPAVLRDVVHEFFAHRSAAARTQLHELLRIGRISLLVGVVFLSVAIGLAGIVARGLAGHQVGEMLREGLVICGWVAMWRPIEIFLYGWWPIRARARLYDRLSVMPVRLEYTDNQVPESWRGDWPAVPAPRMRSQKSRSSLVTDVRQADSISVTDRGPVTPRSTTHANS
ncbi:hypothetical protein BH11MYX2_BH11MYX2_37810 [soil metagenome]